MLVFASASIWAVGCAKDEPAAVADAPRMSRKGEACRVTGDCTDGLSCVPVAGGGGVCVVGEFKIAATAKECAIVECSAAADCCPQPAAQNDCAQFKQMCQQGGDQATCKLYKTQCDCAANAAALFACDKDLCHSIDTCAKDGDCASGHCSSGACVACLKDTDCGGGGGADQKVCVDNVCRPMCALDSDCPSFQRCTKSVCQDGDGCLTDRECVAATKNVQAVCTAGACTVPCQTDLECSSPKDFQFYSCISNQCTYVGCESDKECELYLGTMGSANQKVVCRDKAK